MPAVAQVGKSVAGGTILGPGATSVLTEGLVTSIVGDSVQGHGISPHDAPHMVEGSPNVFAEGKPVCREGDAASCGHTATDCANTVFANGQ